MVISFIPQSIIKRLSSDDRKQIHWNVLLSTCIVLVVMAIVPLKWLDALPHFCLIQKLGGIPCPACGIIRSVASLFDLHFRESVHFHPVGIALVSSFLLQIPLRMMALHRARLNAWAENLSKWITRFIIASLLVYWLFEIISLKI